MKIQSFLIALAASSTVSGFTTTTLRPTNAISHTRNYMFGGAGAAAPKEDDPEAQKQLEQAAKSMGMSVEEYQLGMLARERLSAELDALRISNGNKETVCVNRDGHNPPQFLEVVITEKGKGMGKDEVSKELVAALTAGSAESRTGRGAAQKNMMQFIADEMKRMGVA